MSHLRLTLKEALLQGGHSGQNFPLELYRSILLHEALQCGPVAFQSSRVLLISLPSDL